LQWIDGKSVAPQAPEHARGGQHERNDLVLLDTSGDDSEDQLLQIVKFVFPHGPRAKKRRANGDLAALGPKGRPVIDFTFDAAADDVLLADSDREVPGDGLAETSHDVRHCGVIVLEFHSTT
jgi:hypothetical protein